MNFVDLFFTLIWAGGCIASILGAMTLAFWLHRRR